MQHDNTGKLMTRKVTVTLTGEQLASSQPRGLDPETQIDELVDRHLEAMVREIQDRLGVESGVS